MGPMLFDEQRVRHDAQDVVAALTAAHYGANPDEFLLRDTVAGQMYLTAAAYTVMRRMLKDIAELTGLTEESYLQSLALRVAAKVAGPVSR